MTSGDSDTGSDGRPRPALQCSGGQQYHRCGGCTPTCEDRNPACPRKCQQGCLCPQELPIWHQGRCIREESCPSGDSDTTPVCTGGQVYNRCGRCTRTCEDKNPVCPMKCHVGCQCPPDRPILHRGRCVGEESCPRTQPECSGGRRWSECGSACVATCSGVAEACTLQCVPRCTCPSSAPVWHNNQCIPQAECPSEDSTYSPCPPSPASRP